jgi:hypothetical protein
MIEGSGLTTASAKGAATPAEKVNAEATAAWTGLTSVRMAGGGSKRHELYRRGRRTVDILLAGRLSKFAKNVIVRRGGMSARQSRAAAEALATIPMGEERVWVATGRSQRVGPCR